MNLTPMSMCSLGQLATMAGIDRSDLQPVRGPHPSHPSGSHRGDGDLLSGVGHRDVGTRTDPVSSVRGVISLLHSTGKLILKKNHRLVYESSIAQY